MEPGREASANNGALIGKSYRKRKRVDNVINSMSLKLSLHRVSLLGAFPVTDIWKINKDNKGLPHPQFLRGEQEIPQPSFSEWQNVSVCVHQAGSEDSTTYEPITGTSPKRQNKAAWLGNCWPRLFFFSFFLHGVSNSIIEVEQVTRCSHPLNVSSSPCQGQRSSHKRRSSAPTHRWRGRWQAGEQRSSRQTLSGKKKEKKKASNGGKTSTGGGAMRQTARQPSKHW